MGLEIIIFGALSGFLNLYTLIMGGSMAFGAMSGFGRTLGEFRINYIWKGQVRRAWWRQIKKSLDSAMKYIFAFMGDIISVVLVYALFGGRSIIANMTASFIGAFISIMLIMDQHNIKVDIINFNIYRCFKYHVWI